jgi:hypothetical protein
MGTVPSGETPEFVWLQEVSNEVLRDVGDRTSADMNLLIHMCRGEPKSAQFALQWLAQELNSMLNGRSVDAAEGSLEKTLAFQLGAIGIAYAVSQTPPGEDPTVPPELETLIRWHPLIVECMNRLSPPTIG